MTSNIEANDGRKNWWTHEENKSLSTNDSKALKPDTLETLLRPLQLNNWFKKWDNYMIASGFRQEQSPDTVDLPTYSV